MRPVTTTHYLFLTGIHTHSASAITRQKHLKTKVNTRNCTLGSSPNCANCTSFRRLRAVLMISLHFFGVSSTLPAKKRQQAPVTCRDTYHTITSPLQTSGLLPGVKQSGTIRFTYISGKLLEGVKHVEAVEIYDARCQCVVVSKCRSRTHKD